MHGNSTTVGTTGTTSSFGGYTTTVLNNNLSSQITTNGVLGTSTNLGMSHCLGTYTNLAVVGSVTNSTISG